LTEHSLYAAFTKPQVKQLYNQQLEVLRTSERARNIHALCEVRDQTISQQARVSAVNSLTTMDNLAGHGSAAGASAGFIIQVIAAPGMTIAGKTIDGEVMASGSKADSVEITR
jgi:hypothetical protein